MKRLSIIALALSFSVAAHAACPFNTKEECALDAAADRAIANAYQPQQQDTPHPSVNICRGMTDEECAAEKKRAKRNYAYASRIQPPPQRYIDHYEPQSTCQPSQVITREDAFNAWAGVSSGPTGMDCVTVFVPVYR